MVTRETIEAKLHELNAAENARHATGVEAVSAKIDRIMAEDVEGWRNGHHFSSRAAERDLEKKAFGALVDYHRTFELMIVDPPYAALTWTIRGTANGQKVEAPGCSNFEFDEDGRVRRYWMYFNPADFAYRN